MKKIQLILTNPCAKQWGDLQPSSAGRYCDSCEKNIVDLSTKSDEELLQFLTRKRIMFVAAYFPVSSIESSYYRPQEQAGNGYYRSR